MPLFFALIIVALGVGFGIGSWHAQRRITAHAQLPVLGTAPAYTLTNQLGAKVDSKNFAGKVQVVTFLFPYCTEYCPLIAANLVSLERVLQAAHLAGRVQLVAFDVDPAHTGPKVMAAFMRQYGWNPRDTRWQYLTGTPQQIRQVVTGGFHVDYEQVPEALAERQAKEAEKQGLYTPPPQVVNPLAQQAKPDYDVTHNDTLIVVDGHGRIRRIFPQGARVSDDDLLTVIRALLAKRQ